MSICSPQSVTLSTDYSLEIIACHKTRLGSSGLNKARLLTAMYFITFSVNGKEHFY